MITKLLSVLSEIFRNPTSAIPSPRPFQNAFEWQGEFLFIREKQCLKPVPHVSHLPGSQIYLKRVK